MSAATQSTAEMQRQPVHPLAKERLLKVLKALQLAVYTGVSFEGACRLLGESFEEVDLWRCAYLDHGLNGLNPEVLP